MSEKGAQSPQRAVWPVRKVGVRKPIPTQSGVAAKTYGNAIMIGGTVETLKADEIESGAYSSEDEVIRVNMLGSPFTRSIGRGWRLDLGDASYDVKRIELPDQYKVELEAKRLKAAI